jgi:hypothetical protein
MPIFIKPFMVNRADRMEKCKSRHYYETKFHNTKSAIKSYGYWFDEEVLLLLSIRDLIISQRSANVNTYTGCI